MESSGRQRTEGAEFHRRPDEAILRVFRPQPLKEVVIPGLDPGIIARLFRNDGRVKPGHDDFFDAASASDAAL
jgi:hypothetical protein